MFAIYLIHNTINNKVYVGKSEYWEKRWKKHLYTAMGSREKEKFYIHRAIKKYGAENFTFTPFQFFDDEDNCSKAETYWIVNYFKSNNPQNGYNLTLGGEGSSGRTVSEETKQKIREKKLNSRHTPETIIKMSGENNVGAKVTEKEVIEIRKKCATKQYTLVELAKEYNVTPKTIKYIVNYDTWKHVIVDGAPTKYKRFKPQKLIESNSGENAYNNKLTKRDVLQIRRLYKNTECTQKELAKKFGVNSRHISRIVNKKRWKHI